MHLQKGLGSGQVLMVVKHRDSVVNGQITVMRNMYKYLDRD